MVKRAGIKHRKKCAGLFFFFFISSFSGALHSWSINILRVFHEQCMGSILSDPHAKLSNASINSGSAHFLHKRAQTKQRVNTPTRSFPTVCGKKFMLRAECEPRKRNSPLCERSSISPRLESKRSGVMYSRKDEQKVYECKIPHSILVTS